MSCDIRPYYVSGLDEICLSSKIRKRGRPKGAEKTVIGLPKKKGKTSKPLSFCKKQPSDKDRGQCTTVCEIEMLYHNKTSSLF